MMASVGLAPSRRSHSPRLLPRSPANHNELPMRAPHSDILPRKRPSSSPPLPQRVSSPSHYRRTPSTTGSTTTATNMNTSKNIINNAAATAPPQNRTKMVMLAGVNLIRRFTSSYSSSTGNGGGGNKNRNDSNNNYNRSKGGSRDHHKKLDQELDRLNSKIDGLLNKLDDDKPELALTKEEECLTCCYSRATMQTFPCGHQVLCRGCFVKTIQATVAQKKLPLRCVHCQAKVLRLQQHPSSFGGRPRPSRGSTSYDGRRLSASPSGISFASSGVSTVSSASSSSSLRSFNFDSFSNFQNMNLSKGKLTRTASGNSIRSNGSLRRCRTPSPAPSNHRGGRFSSRRGGAWVPAASPSTTTCRTSSEESLLSSASSAAGTATGASAAASPPHSPAASWSQPRSSHAISPSSQNFLNNNNGLVENEFPIARGAIFSSYTGYADSGASSSSSSSSLSSARSSRLGTPLSPIRESRRESSACCSPEHTPSPTPSSNQFNNRRAAANSRPSTRIRCADKILTQLELHAEAERYFGSGSNEDIYDGEKHLEGWQFRRGRRRAHDQEQFYRRSLSECEGDELEWAARGLMMGGSCGTSEKPRNLCHRFSRSLDGENNNSIMRSPGRTPRGTRRAKSVTFKDC